MIWSHVKSKQNLHNSQDFLALHQFNINFGVSTHHIHTLHIFAGRLLLLSLLLLPLLLRFFYISLIVLLIVVESPVLKAQLVCRFVEEDCSGAKEYKVGEECLM